MTEMIITRARVLLSHGVERVNVHIRDGIIVNISDHMSDSVPYIDADGLLLVPGMVDIHGDAFERQCMPRPGVKFPLDLALTDTDQQLASNGITTAYHGITWSWEGGLRGGESAQAIIKALKTLKFAVKHRIHLRYEMHNVIDAEEINLLLKSRMIDLLAFNDHFYEIDRKTRQKPEALEKYADRAETDPASFLKRIEHARKFEHLIEEMVMCLSTTARHLGVPMASHDDLTYLDRKKFMEKGVHISEFPRSAEAIDAARAFKSPIILGAPNVVRGGSHCGAVDATASVLSGHCDILASDYYYPALLLAPFKLTQYGLPLSMAWRLVSKNPARTLGLDNCGEIDVGKSADLLLIDDRQATLPKICMTMCDGEVIHLTRRDLMLSEVTLTV